MRLFRLDDVQMIAKFSVTGIVVFGLVPALFTLERNMLFSVTHGLLIGLMIGVFERLFFQGALFDRKLKRYSFSFLLLIRTVAHSAIWLISSIFMLYLALMVGGWSLQDYSNPEFFGYFNRNYSTLSLQAVVPLCFLISLFWQINSLVGKGVLIKYFIGRYHKPRAEGRIVMFLDLNAATSIAEQLGPHKYSSFLQDFFFDISDAVLECKGEIVQYVGDEVIVTWSRKHGIHKSRCLAFFFRVEDRIRQLEENYTCKFGVIPRFKAGLHYGEVVVTEVGKIKKEIAYHGDPMNTASRICSTSGALNKKLLVSSDLLNILDKDEAYCIENLGPFRLKGKEQNVELNSISRIRA